MVSSQLICADCIIAMKDMADNSVDSIVTDPPYGLEFMGKKWDYDVPSVEIWKECFRVLKPGGHLLCFGGSRTYHRVAVNIEDAQFEIRDQLQWLYGSGFPKSLSLSRQLDKRGGESVAWFGQWLREWREENGIKQKEVAALFPSHTGNLTGCVANWELGFNIPTNEQFNLICDTFDLPFESLEEAQGVFLGTITHSRSGGDDFAKRPGSKSTSREEDLHAPGSDAAKQWDGWGTGLKPAHEPIVMARKPIEGTVVENVLEHGTGAINIDGCRIGTNEKLVAGGSLRINSGDEREGAALGMFQDGTPNTYEQNQSGRYPANVILDEEAGAMLDEQAPSVGNMVSGVRKKDTRGGTGHTLKASKKKGTTTGHFDGLGGASRFFYCAKPSQKERSGGLEHFASKPAFNYGSIKKSEGRHGENTPRKNVHPTVKPVDLMRYLCRLVTPPEGIVLDPFMGSGTTGIAANLEGFNFIGIDMEEEYVEIARARIAHSGEYVITEDLTMKRIKQPTLFDFIS